MNDQTYKLSRRILGHASKERLEAGSPLSVSGLAKICAVSRTPVVNALKMLADNGLVRHELNRGYFLVKDGREAERDIRNGHKPSDNYLALTRLVKNRGDGNGLTAAELVKALTITRTRALALLERGTAEGWLEKSAGHSWIIRSGITSSEDYLRLYRFRETIEPAALREPGFAADRAELDRLLSIQKRLAEGDFHALTAVDLFEINRELHETIVGWSGNRFYLDALRRSNDLRRLIEYSKVLETRKVDHFASEHVSILNAINTGDLKRAEQLVLKHLQGARQTKT